MRRKQLVRTFVAILLLYLIATTIRAIFDLSRAGEKLTSREEKAARLKKEQEELSRQKVKVNNPEYWERVARDQLNMSRPGEEIIIIPAELLALPPAASPDATPVWEKWRRLVF